MGSTEIDKRFTQPTRNVAVRHFAKNEFVFALKELQQLKSGANDLDVIVMQTICEYRLGGKTTALTELRSQYGSRLSSEQMALVFRHEVLGNIRFRRYQLAISLLEGQQLPQEEAAALQLLRSALSVLKEGQRTPLFRRRSDRIGITTSREARSVYLPTAISQCSSAIMATRSLTSETAHLIELVGTSMALICEMLLPSAMHSKSIVRCLRKQLGAVDGDFKKSLPFPVELVKFRHEF